jgi:Nucleotide modification associated domain 1
MGQTSEQYQQIVQNCREIFKQKTKDYGTSWRIARASSLTDQIFIKANRIRTIQETNENKVGESIEGEFGAIVNYCVMAIIQVRDHKHLGLELTEREAVDLYDQVAQEAYDLMQKKNHDYGEAWRDMRVSSLTDMILMKLLRVKQIEDNDGQTIVSEGIDANYFDMLNYAVFALIHLTN